MDRDSDVQFEIILDKSNAAYKPKEYCLGQVIFKDSKEHKFNTALVLKAEGKIKIQHQQRNKTAIDFLSEQESLIIFKYEQELCKNQDIQPNQAFPFKFLLDAMPHEFVETYLGVYIQIEYEITATLVTKLQQHYSAFKSFDMIIQNWNKNILQNLKRPNPLQFTIVPKTLIQNMSVSKTPQFKIQLEVQSNVCKIQDDALQGTYFIEECTSEIKSVDIQLIRVESVETKKGHFSEATEIQLLQIGEGNVSHNIQIPFYMIFPKYFSCPNFQYKEFMVSFQINFIVMLKEGFKITQNFPLYLVR